MKRYEVRKVTMYIYGEHDEDGYTHDSSNVAELLLDSIGDVLDVRSIIVEEVKDAYVAGWNEDRQTVRFANTERK